MYASSIYTHCDIPSRGGGAGNDDRQRQRYGFKERGVFISFRFTFYLCLPL